MDSIVIPFGIFSNIDYLLISTYFYLLSASFALEEDRLHHSEVSAKELHASVKLLQVHWRPSVAIVSLHVAQT